MIGAESLSAPLLASWSIPPVYNHTTCARQKRKRKDYHHPKHPYHNGMVARWLRCGPCRGLPIGEVGMWGIRRACAYDCGPGPRAGPCPCHGSKLGYLQRGSRPRDALCYFPFSIRLARSLGAVILVDYSAVRIGAMIACLERGYREPTGLSIPHSKSSFTHAGSFTTNVHTSYSGSLTVPHDLRRRLHERMAAL